MICSCTKRRGDGSDGKNSKHEPKMARFFKLQKFLHKVDVPSIPEEVGMDVAEALGVLDIKEEIVKLEKNQLDTKENEKCQCKCKPKKAPFRFLPRASRRNLLNKVPSRCISYPTLTPSSSLLLKKASKDFNSELKNELNNAPEPSSKSLAAWFRSSTPSRSKNVLFKEAITSGHLRGCPQKCQVLLTPQVITLSKRKTLHIIIDDIQFIQLDELHTICTIFAANQQELVQLENFPPGRLSKFLLVLNYLIHLSRPRKRLIRYFSWNFALDRQKMPRILVVFPVTLSIESQSAESQYLESFISYKIEKMLHDDLEALDLLEARSYWKTAFWRLKLNTLYAYKAKGDETPFGFWLMSNAKEISAIDSDDDEFLLEVVLDHEIIILRFDHEQSLEAWKVTMEKARKFDASLFFSGETVTDVKDVFLTLDKSSILTFNLDENHVVSNLQFQFIESIEEKSISEFKPQCHLVVNAEAKKVKWRLAFSHYSYAVTFLQTIERLCNSRK